MKTTQTITTSLIFAAIMAASMPAMATSPNSEPSTVKTVEQTAGRDLVQPLGHLIATALCQGWAQGRQNLGCKDAATATLWAKSSDPSVKAKGDACLAGMASMGGRV